MPCHIVVVVVVPRMRVGCGARGHVSRRYTSRRGAMRRNFRRHLRWAQRRTPPFQARTAAGSVSGGLYCSRMTEMLLPAPLLCN